MLRYFLLIVLLHSYPLSATGEGVFVFSEQAVKTYQLSSALRIKEAQQELEQLKRAEPKNLIAVYLEHYMDFIQVISTDKRSTYQTFQKNLLPRIDKLSRGDRSSPYHLFLQAEMRLHGALLHSRFNNMLGSLSEVKTAYKLLEENQKRHPEFKANDKSLGVLHTILGSIPEEYQWTVKNLGGMQGDVEKGKEELKKLAAYARNHPEFVWRDEVHIIYAYLLLFAGNDKDGAWTTIQQSGIEPKKNPLGAYIMASIASRSGHNDEAIKLLEQSPTGGQYAPFPYRYFSLGMYHLFRLDPESDQYFKQFLQQCKGEMGVKEALQKLAWHQLLSDNAAGYQRYIAEIKKKGSNRSETDKAAQQEADRGEAPHPLLLKARLLFDGGYYSRALETLEGKTAQLHGNSKNEIEYQYRLGRICHEAGDTDRAITYYTQTIEMGKSKPWYFACNAALQLGKLYEDTGKNNQAVAAYQSCLRMKPEEYKSSLHAMAKAGINRLKT
ncbi:MAG: tetratricopeptide repeat protein [Saprospiraceae bacterium]